MKLHLPLGAVLLLTTCSTGGPSESDLQRIYQAAVSIKSCAKVNDSTYRCRFSFLAPKFAGDMGEHTQCFVTDGTTWDVKIFC
jgi:hypothetical protein